MIGFIGWESIDYDEAFDEAEAFFAYIEDPDSDLALVLAVEEWLGVRA
ncbi:hypothetical protein ACIPX0_26260 [Streptomyces sp. NPDC090075]